MSPFFDAVLVTAPGSFTAATLTDHLNDQLAALSEREPQGHQGRSPVPPAVPPASRTATTAADATGSPGPAVTEPGSRSENALERIHDLEHALQTRIVIEQAKGVLHERLGLTVDDAFTLLRYAARTARRPIHDLAADVLATRKTPPPVIRAIAKQQQWRAALHRERNQAREERLQRLTEQVRAHQRHIEERR